MSVKVMVAFGLQTFSLLEAEAKERGVSIQELLRAVIIPEWFRVRSDSPEKPANLRSGDTRTDTLSTSIYRPSNHRLQ